MHVLKHRKLLASAILGLWLFVIVGGFWWFELRWLRPFLDQVALFDGEQITHTYGNQLAMARGNGDEQTAITVMHFADSDCPCNRFNLPHVQEIQHHYQQQGVNFVSWQQGKQPVQLDGFSINHQVAQLAHVPATPAVAIWSANGDLAYFGPYSSGLLCTLGEGFAETILDQLLAGQSPQVINTTGVGCFCPTANRSV